MCFPQHNCAVGAKQGLRVLQRRGICLIFIAMKITAMRRPALAILVWLPALAVLASGCSRETPRDTRQAKSRYEAGTGYINQRLYDKAIEEFDRATEFDPDYAQAYCDRGIARYMKGEHALALKDFEIAIEKDPTLGKAHFHRALLLDQAGKTSEAIEGYEDFIRHSQRSPEVYIARANRRLAELKENAPPPPR
jgi:Tfp pilus assembly protein PilF